MTSTSTGFNGVVWATVLSTAFRFTDQRITGLTECSIEIENYFINDPVEVTSLGQAWCVTTCAPPDCIPSVRRAEDCLPLYLVFRLDSSLNTDAWAGPDRAARVQFKARTWVTDMCPRFGLHSVLLGLVRFCALRKSGDHLQSFPAA
jgi:hypothetical protein